MSSGFLPPHFGAGSIFGTKKFEVLPPFPYWPFQVEPDQEPYHPVSEVFQASWFHPVEPQSVGVHQGEGEGVDEAPWLVPERLAGSGAAKGGTGAVAALAV